MSCEPIVDYLLTRAPTPAAMTDVPSWWRQHHEVVAALELPIDRALAGGFVAPVLGFAFASGYQEALRALLGGGEERRRALCATEKGGNHPRAIATTLTPAGDGFVLSGAKSYITLGRFADELLVVARSGTGSDDRPQLTVVTVAAGATGVTIEDAPPVPFVPEIPHARVRFAEVAIATEDVLPGDGYDRYLKPFRTVEDIHVMAALMAWLIGVGRRSNWSEDAIEPLLATALTLRQLALAAPSSPAIHIALAGALRMVQHSVAEVEPLWASADLATRATWQRDRALLQVAQGARDKRRQRAWERLASLR